MNHWRPENGWPFPYGSTWSEALQGFNFALYSKASTRVELCFFAREDPGRLLFSVVLDPTANKTGTIWHCFVGAQQLGNANCYAYRVDGPAEAGTAFDPQKLLLDPWARAIHFPAAFSRSRHQAPGDNTGVAALAALVKNDSDPPGFRQHTRPTHYHDLVIYELHVRGFTRHSSSGVQHAGTFSGVIEKIPYLQELGITAVELMPVHQFDPQENNYWGYMTLNFFSPHQSYGSFDDPWEIVREFKRMVHALHEAGIEVILDVIYNHTVEGGTSGPRYSYKGIDNSSYYLLTPDLARYNDDAGTGNVLRTSYKVVRQLILDSLRYWVLEMQVDGFRFDLASIFTRNDDGSVNRVNPPLLEEISFDPVLSGVRLIAEPWDMKEYQLGRRFPGSNWAQWNGAYRDDIRCFIKSDPDKVASVMSRVYGSADFFPESHPLNGRPFESFNFVTSHDGFSLYDLVAYNQKHNDANGHGNQDGTTDNFSWNCGWEGDEQVPAHVLRLRKQQAKNFATLLFFSNGVPMFRMGDEFLHTQGGNNNAYNQDNATSWLDWDRRAPMEDVLRFFQQLIRYRKAHPILSPGRFWRDDVHWFGVNGQPDLSYSSRSLAYWLNGAALGDDDFYVLLNAYWEPLTFRVSATGPENWQRIVDTAQDSPADIAEPGQGTLLQNMQVPLQPRSVVVLQRHR